MNAQKILYYKIKRCCYLFHNEIVKYILVIVYYDTYFIIFCHPEQTFLSSLSILSEYKIMMKSVRIREAKVYDMIADMITFFIKFSCISISKMELPLLQDDKTSCLYTFRVCMLWSSTGKWCMQHYFNEHWCKNKFCFTLFKLRVVTIFLISSSIYIL